jgi:hypothetical protein
MKARHSITFSTEIQYFNIMLTAIVMMCAYAEYRTECGHAECCNSECHQVECGYAESFYAGYL